MNFTELLTEMVKHRAKVLHLRAGTAPVFRVDGKLFKSKSEPLEAGAIDSAIEELFHSKEKAEKYKQFGLTHLTLRVSGLGRFKVSAYRQRGTSALCVRSLLSEIPNFDSLGLPQVLLDMAMKRKGLLLFGGGPGSGKSSAMAAVLEHLNESTFSNILTIEDPIEFTHLDKNSLIAQMEIGEDTPDFTMAVSHCLLQDPDVVFVSEIRDRESLESILKAADSGILVITSLRTQNAVETLRHILSFYPVERETQVRSLLANCLSGIACLQLLRGKSQKPAKVAACEILVNNPSIKEALTAGKPLKELHRMIEEGSATDGSQSFDQSIYRLFQEEQISKETALKSTPRPDNFELKLRGIEGSSDRSWNRAQ